MDPHISRFQDNNDFEGSMEDMMLARRAEKLYRTLSEKGEFAKLDKARHNEQYRNYLLQNFEDEDYF